MTPEPIKHYEEINSIKESISKELTKTRESSLVITKLDEALMWLDRYYYVEQFKCCEKGE